jgi:hypothetical protein
MHDYSNDKARVPARGWVSKPQGACHAATNAPFLDSTLSGVLLFLDEKDRSGQDQLDATGM